MLTIVTPIKIYPLALSPNPLNFFAAFFFVAGFLIIHELAARLVALGPCGRATNFVLSWVRFFTAPLRALSPTGMLTAI